MGARALRMVKFLKRTRKPEVKIVEVEKATFTRGVMLELANMPEGTTDGQRIGHKVFLKTLSLKCIWQIPDANTDPGMKSRMLVIRWMGQSAPTIGNIISPFGSANDIVAGWYLTKDQAPALFRVIKDYKFNMYPRLVEGAAGRWNEHIREFAIPLNWQKYYDGPLTTDGLRGRLYIYWTMDTTSTAPTALFYSRIRYTDV